MTCHRTDWNNILILYILLSFICLLSATNKHIKKSFVKENKIFRFKSHSSVESSITSFYYVFFVSIYTFLFPFNIFLFCCQTVESNACIMYCINIQRVDCIHSLFKLGVTLTFFLPSSFRSSYMIILLLLFHYIVVKCTWCTYNVYTIHGIQCCFVFVHCI